MDPDQPYCGRCGERKATWGLVKRHLKEKHGEKLTCPLCHKYSTASSTKYRLRRHIENVHKVDPSKYISTVRKSEMKHNKEIPSLFSIKIATPVRKYQSPCATNSKAPKQDTCISVNKETDYKLKTPMKKHLESESIIAVTESSHEEKPATPRSPWRLSEDSLESPLIDINCDEQGNVTIQQKKIIQESQNDVKLAEPPKVSRSDTPKLLKTGLIKPKIHKLELHSRKDQKAFSRTVHLHRNQLKTVTVPTSPLYACTNNDPRNMFAGAPSEVIKQFDASPLRKIRKRALRQKGNTTEFLYPSSVGSVKKIEKAILPDGTIYQLETMWCKDPDYKVKRTTNTQTSPRNNKEEHLNLDSN